MTSAEEHRWVIDSIEEQMASIEVDGGRMITVPIAVLPAAARQGHVLAVRREASSDGKRASLVIEIDEAATAAALAASAAQVERGRAASKKHDRGGDIVL